MYSTTTFNNLVNDTNHTSSTRKEIILYASTSFYIFLLLCALSILLHSIGLFLLLKVKRRKLLQSRSTANNNNILPLINLYLLTILCVAEVVQTINAIAFVVSANMRKIILVYILGFINIISVGFSLSTVSAITLNRLLSILFPLRCRSTMSMRKAFIWFTCISVFINGCFIVALAMGASSNEANRSIGKLLFGSMFIIFFVFCVLTYLAIFFTIISSKQKLHGNPSTGIFNFIVTYLRDHNYTVPVFVTTTYTLFIAVPMIVQTICGFTNSTYCFTLAQDVWYITHYLNNISDALAYVLCDRDICTYLKNRYKRNNRQKKVCRGHNKDDKGVKKDAQGCNEINEECNNDNKEPDEEGKEKEKGGEGGNKDGKGCNEGAKGCNSVTKRAIEDDEEGSNGGGKGKKESN